MAEHSAASEHRSDEIAALRRQMEEMSKRLEELSAAEAAGQETPAKSEERPMTAKQEAPAKPEERSAAAGQEGAKVNQPAQAAASKAQSAAQPVGQAQPYNPYGGGYAGQQVPIGSAQQQYYQQAQQAYYGYAAQQNVYSPPVARTKDHVAAGLLGIFLGALGIHKFYLGYSTSGFIMLGIAIVGGIFTFGLAAGVMWLIGLIEGVLYLLKSQAEFEQIYVYQKREWF